MSSLLWFIMIGLAAGWLVGQLVKGPAFRVMGDIVIGVTGALIGGLLFGMLGVSSGDGLTGSLIMATIGAVVLLLVLRRLMKA